MNPYLLAMTKLAYDIKPQQQRVLDKLDAQNGVVVMHGMGSGKTLTSLIAAEREQKRDPNATIQVVVPAPLVSNMYDQAKEHGVDLDYKRFNVVSYEKATNNINALKATKPSLLIMDEGQRIRNKGTARSENIRSLADASRKVMILSGTPDYNGPQDMAVLVNTVAKKDVLPDDKKGFEDRYIENVEVKPGFFAHHVLGVPSGSVQKFKNKRELHKVLSKYVDTYDARESSPEHFPSSRESIVKVDMDHQQEQMYKFVEGKVPFYIRWKINRGLPLNKTESRDLNAFSTGVRQVSNSTAAYSPTSTSVSPKLKKMADHIEHMKKNDPNFRSVAYSNYLESGLKPLSQELNRRGIKHALYDGSLSQKEKDAIVHDYNHGKLDTVLVSSSGQEGLNLKGTKLVQIMEPHFNRSKIDQVIARGIRYNSHAHLPENERHVEVVHYQSVIPHHLFGGPHKSIDEYLYDSSSRKKHLQDDLRDMMKSSSVADLVTHYPHIWEAAKTMLEVGGLHMGQNAAIAGKLAVDAGMGRRAIGHLQGVRVPGLGQFGDLSRSEVLNRLQRGARKGPNSWGGQFYRGLHDAHPTWGQQARSRLMLDGLLPEVNMVGDKMRSTGSKARSLLLEHGIDPSKLAPHEVDFFRNTVGGRLRHAHQIYQDKVTSGIDPHRMNSLVDAAHTVLSRTGNRLPLHDIMQKKDIGHDLAGKAEKAIQGDLLLKGVAKDLADWRHPSELPTQAVQGAPAWVRKTTSALQRSRLRNAPVVRQSREFLERHLDDRNLPHAYLPSLMSAAASGRVESAAGLLSALKVTADTRELEHTSAMKWVNSKMVSRPLQDAYQQGKEGRPLSKVWVGGKFLVVNPLAASADVSAHRMGSLSRDVKDSGIATPIHRATRPIPPEKRRDWRSPAAILGGAGVAGAGGYLAGKHRNSD